MPIKSVQEHGYYFIESFAGFGAATHEVKTLFPKKKSVAMDILYSSSLDLTKSCGMALLG